MGHMTASVIADAESTCKVRAVAKKKAPPEYGPLRTLVQHMRQAGRDEVAMPSVRRRSVVAAPD